MRISIPSTLPIIVFSSIATASNNVPAVQSPLDSSSSSPSTTRIPLSLFNSLEEHARLVDIAYCVGLGGIGITQPFNCASRCDDFPHFELVTTWNTGPLLSDSCGYIALSHSPSAERIILAFRGTYSLSNTLVDLATIPQPYVPYPGDETNLPPFPESLDNQQDHQSTGSSCTNCTAHLGFFTSWQQARKTVVPAIEHARALFPHYKLTIVGHSLGGAVAAFAALELRARGIASTSTSPSSTGMVVTTFGEPRVGNQALVEYIDARFSDYTSNATVAKLHTRSEYRRVTHYNDPVPLLPLGEWGYRMHAGEIYISKPDLSPEPADLRFCEGDADERCIAGGDDATPASHISVDKSTFEPVTQKNVNDVIQREVLTLHDEDTDTAISQESRQWWPVPSRYRAWQLFFAHRDYFWRIGLCVPGGDPKDWYRKYPKPGGDEEWEKEL